MCLVCIWWLNRHTLWVWVCVDDDQLLIDSSISIVWAFQKPLLWFLYHCKFFTPKTTFEGPISLRLSLFAGLNIWMMFFLYFIFALKYLKRSMKLSRKVVWLQIYTGIKMHPNHLLFVCVCVGSTLDWNNIPYIFVIVLL